MQNVCLGTVIQAEFIFLNTNITLTNILTVMSVLDICRVFK